MMRRTLGVTVVLLLAASVGQSTPLAPFWSKPAIAAVEWISGLPVSKEVPVADLTVEETREYLRKQIEEELANVDVKGQAEAMGHFGFLPRGFDFAKSYLNLLTAQVAAFYDLRTGRYYNVNRFGPTDLIGEPVTVSHELTHAAQDQAVALQPVFDARKDDDDRARAVHWVMEGQATLMGNRAGNMMSLPFPGPLGLAWGEVSTFLLWSPPFRTLSRVAMQNMGQEGETVPAFLVDSLLDAYVEGSKFVWTLERAIGRDVHVWLLCHPPQSTEQMLHPEKYLRGVDPPVRVRIPSLGGVSVRTDLTLGEWSLRWLVGNADDAADWGGDRMALMQDGTAVWRVVMDSEGAATRLLSVLKQKVPGVALRLRGREVHLLSGFAEDVVDARSDELLAQKPAWYAPDPPAGGRTCVR